MTFLRSLSKKKGAAYSFFSAAAKTAFPAILIALLHLILSVVLPVTEFVSINTAAKSDLSGNAPTADKLYDFMVYGSNGFLDTSLIYIILAILGFMSIMTAVKVFSFICDKKTVNVYYSLGIKRSVLFVSRYLGGAFSLAIATAVPFTLSYIVNLIFLGASVPMSLALLHLFTGFYIFSLICYSITSAVFSSVGTVSEAQIFSVAIIFAPSILIFSLQQIITAFLPSAAYGIRVNHFTDVSYSYSASSLLEQTQSFNPLLFFTDDIYLYSVGKLSDDNKVMLVRDALWENPATYKLLPWFIVCLAASVIGLLLFRRIKAENCGFLDTNKILSNLTTFGMCLTAVCLFLGELRWESPVIVIGLGVFVALILYLAAEIFLKRSFKKIVRSIYKFAIHMVVIAIIFGIFITGAFGFDKYIPDRRNVVSAEVSVPFSYSSITTVNLGYGWNSDMFMRVFEPYEYRFLPAITDEEDIDALMEMHEYFNNNDTDDGIGNNIIIRYNLKDGSYSERLLRITSREETEKLFSLFDMSSYKNELKNLFYKENRLEEIYDELKNNHYVDESMLTALCFEYEFSDVILRTDSLNEHFTLKLSREEFSELKDAVYKDLYSMSAKEFFTGEARQLGVLSFAVNEKAYEIEGINEYYEYTQEYYEEGTTSVTVPEENEADEENSTKEDTAPVGEDNKTENALTEAYSEYPYEGLGNLSSYGIYDIVITENMKNTVAFLSERNLVGLLESVCEVESVTLRKFNTAEIFSYYANLDKCNFMLEFFAYSFSDESYYYYPDEIKNNTELVTVTDADTLRKITDNTVLHGYTFNEGYFCLIKYTNGSYCVKYLSENNLPEELKSSF